MCITSPPYWGLRDYGTEGQIWGGNPECEHEFKKSKNIRYDLEFQKKVLEEAIEALKYKDKFPNDATNSEGR